MLKFGIKSAILGTAVYYTIDKGVWKDSQTTNALYEDLEQGVSPYVGELKKKVPIELPSLPSEGKVTYLFKHYWNCGVKSTFKFLINLPNYAADATYQAYETVVSALDSQTKDASQDKIIK